MRSSRRRIALAVGVGVVLLLVGALLLNDVAQAVAMFLGIFVLLFAVVRAIDSEGSRRRETASAKDRAGGPAHPWGI